MCTLCVCTQSLWCSRVWQCKLSHFQNICFGHSKCCEFYRQVFFSTGIFVVFRVRPYGDEYGFEVVFVPNFTRLQIYSNRMALIAFSRFLHNYWSAQYCCYSATVWPRNDRQYVILLLNNVTHSVMCVHRTHNTCHSIYWTHRNYITVREHLVCNVYVCMGCSGACVFYTSDSQW